jgi:hypothetical protein
MRLFNSAPFALEKSLIDLFLLFMYGIPAPVDGVS